MIDCGLFVERHAQQQKQVARLVPCGMFQLPSGCQSCNDLRLLCCASIANDRVAQQQQSQGGILFQEIIFSFPLFSHKANTFP
jgi:hypothetical protein